MQQEQKKEEEEFNIGMDDMVDTVTSYVTIQPELQSREGSQQTSDRRQPADSGELQPRQGRPLSRRSAELPHPAVLQSGPVLQTEQQLTAVQPLQPARPEFLYSLTASTQYRVLLDQTRWDDAI